MQDLQFFTRDLRCSQVEPSSFLEFPMLQVEPTYGERKYTARKRSLFAVINMLGLFYFDEPNAC